MRTAPERSRVLDATFRAQGSAKYFSYTLRAASRSAYLANVRAWILIAALGGAAAPYQCAGDPEFKERKEETPAEALFGLAQQFKARGETQAWRDTLEYLVARYPNSRFAKMAKSDLAEGGGGESAPPPASIDGDSAAEK